MRTLSVMLIAAIALTSCSSYLVRSEFDTSLSQYNNLVRWHELDQASLYAAESLLEEFKVRVKAATDVRVVDYRIVGTRYDAEKRTASVNVEIQYYKLSSGKVKTLHDTQEWAYTEEKGENRWRLVSLLPEFR